MSDNSNFGTRVSYTQANLVNNKFTQVAASDGFVMAVLGSIGYENPFLGLVAGTTSMNGVVTSMVYASSTTQTVNAESGKKGPQTYHVPLPGNFTMLVRSGETWEITLTVDTQIFPAPNLTFYWMPDGKTSSSELNVVTQEMADVHQKMHGMVMASKTDS